MVNLFRLRDLRLVAAVAVVALVVPLAHTAATTSPRASIGTDATTADQKLRAAGLDGFYLGTEQQDALIAGIGAFSTAWIGYFAVLSEPNDAGHLAALTGTKQHTRVLRSYRSETAVALASTPGDLHRIAGLSWVRWLAPIQLVHALADEPIADQTRGTPADVGAPVWWSSGVTGKGVRIAVLDTGVDATHPDLDDLDFRHWSDLVNPPKIIDSRNFNGNVCAAPGSGSVDAHGHGTHVAGIATGTGEGSPLPGDDGRYTGIAPDATLAAAKVLTDAGAGINSDLLAALEWAAMPAGSGDPTCPAIDADIVNLSLGSESRPMRLDSGNDVDIVSYTLNRLAVRYGTLFTVAAGNSGPYIGSVLEAPSSAAQALSVAASAKTWDLNHDDTASGDVCSGYAHPTPPDIGCSAGIGTQRRSLASFSSRGPDGSLWLRPDVSSPGYNIVSAQSSTGAALGTNDLNPNTRADPLYATATGTSMAAPAAAGTAALLLQAYRDRYGADPVGPSGQTGVKANAFALLRAALMNTALADQWESRWMLSVDAPIPPCPPEIDVLFGVCDFADIFAGLAGDLKLQEARNRGADPFVGPLGEGAGKIQLSRAIGALRDGVVMYTAAISRTQPGRIATGNLDLQGTWQIGPIDARAARTQRIVLHAAPSVGPVSATFSLRGGQPSDGSRAIPLGTDPGAWSFTLPGTTSVPQGGNAIVPFSVTIPPDAAPGHYTAVLEAKLSTGRTIRMPVFASVALHDADGAAATTGGAQAHVASAQDVFAKGDTVWPSVLGAAQGAAADWNVYPVRVDADTAELRISVYDARVGDDDETYDLYLYDRTYDLVASTHPFASPGVTDTNANDARGPSTQAAPQMLTVSNPVPGRYFLAVNRAKVGTTDAVAGDFGAYDLTLDVTVAP